MSYEKPLMEIVQIEIQDVITMSGGLNSGIGDGPVIDIEDMYDF